MRLLELMLCGVFSLAFVLTPSPARVIAGHNYQELLDHSDLVVIATPTTRTTDIDEATFFPDFLHVDAKGHQTRVQATGVETRFECVAILKGNSAVKRFVLHHYRQTSLEGEVDGPELVSFDPDDRPDYLLFLMREPDGRFAPTGGQTDPGFKAITKLAN